jgi:hydrogenase nickel incorporation protein HypA/HybF
MHERSLVASLLEKVSETAKTRGLTGIREVVLDVGEFAGVDGTLLTLAFEELAPAVLGDDVRLDVRQTPLTGRCRSCHHDFRIERFRFACPSCGGDVDVTGGEEFRLVSLRVTNTAEEARR